MLSYKEFLKEVFEIRQTEYGTNEPDYDNSEIGKENEFIRYTLFKHNNLIFRVEYYEEIPNELEDKFPWIKNFENSFHYSLFENNEQVSDRLSNFKGSYGVIQNKLFYIFKLLLKNDNPKFINIVSSYKDEKRNKMYDKMINNKSFKEVMNHIGYSFENKITNIDLGIHGFGDKYVFKRRD
jgi:hypothetical protein